MLDSRREDDSYSGVERRCEGQAKRSPSEALIDISALRALEMISQPVLAIGRDGRILFANVPFCEMLGYTQEALLTLAIHQICNLDCQSAFTRMREHAEEPVQLVHRDGYVVTATMSASALRRHDDPLAVVSFNDVTEQLWSTRFVEGRKGRLSPVKEFDSAWFEMADRCGQAAKSQAVEGSVSA
jgi:PAS domain S-box-containing protein